MRPPDLLVHSGQSTNTSSESTNMPLTDAKLRSLKPREKPYKVPDGGGLYVQVTPSGGRLWRLAYRFGGKQKTLYIGPYPTVALAEARDRRHAAKRDLREGRDPGLVVVHPKAAGSFREVAEEWIEARRETWTEKHAGRVQGHLETDVYPVIGSRQIADLGPLDVLAVGRRVEARMALDTARRVMQFCGSIFRYGVATGRCQRDPTADLKDALKAPPPNKRHSALRDDDLPDFLSKLDSYDGEPSTVLAIQFVLLTFVRTSEARFARWDEFDLSEGVWRIPEDRMKMRRTHIVPLARQTIALLKRVREISPGPRLFPSRTAKAGVISENTMIFALYRMGYHTKATIHGFRGTASTILNENGFNRDWIEMQLAHAPGGVRAHYNAAEWLPGRREMMQWWADHLDRRRMDSLI